MESSPNKYLDPGKLNFILPKSNASETDIELWNSFRSGSREALDNIYEKYIRVLYGYGRNITPDRELIADCIQDIFVELWIKRAVIAPNVNSIKFYLIKSLRRKILRRLSMDRRFRNRSVPDNYCEVVEFNIEFKLIQDQISIERAILLKASVATLSNSQQEAVYLKFYENMTYEQAASVMKTNVKAIYNLIGKSIISLRKYCIVHPIPGE